MWLPPSGISFPISGVSVRERFERNNSAAHSCISEILEGAVNILGPHLTPFLPLSRLRNSSSNKRSCMETLVGLTCQVSSAYVTYTGVNQLYRQTQFAL